MDYKLHTDSFSIILKTTVFETDIEYPENTILEVCLKSDDFSACTTMDIDIKEFNIFISQINNLYETLEGSTQIKESYGNQFIEFSVDKKGTILVSGFLHNNYKNGNYQSLQFENSFDQTYLMKFVNSLKSGLFR